MRRSRRRRRNGCRCVADVATMLPLMPGGLPRERWLTPAGQGAKEVSVAWAGKTWRSTGRISATPLMVANASREELRRCLLEIAYGAFEVERLADGRAICITKPAGKGVHDFMVWVYDARTLDRWPITHKALFADVAAKVQEHPDAGRRVIEALQRVHDGDEPDAVLAELPPCDPPLSGEPVELLLKVYKWIFGVEDVNYEHGQGRSMAMDALRGLVGSP